MAEICGAYPSAGSVYHWAGQLASEKHAPLWAYVTGWMNSLGNGAGDASFANGWANFFSAGLSASGYQPLSDQLIVGLSIGILFFWSILNGLRIDAVGWINQFAAIVQGSSILIVFVTLLACSPGYATAEEVFKMFTNLTNSDDAAQPFSVSYVVAAGII